MPMPRFAISGSRESNNFEVTSYAASSNRFRTLKHTSGFVHFPFSLASNRDALSTSCVGEGHATPRQQQRDPFLIRGLRPRILRRLRPSHSFLLWERCLRSLPHLTHPLHRLFHIPNRRLRS